MFELPASRVESVRFERCARGFVYVITDRQKTPLVVCQP